MKVLRFLVFPALAFIIGGHTLSDSFRTEERAGVVEKEPATIVCEQFVENGPPENRHVQITQCRYGQKFAVHSPTDSDKWSWVLIPIYPANVQQDAEGEKIGLVAQIFVRDIVELLEFREKPDVIGCVWDRPQQKSYKDNLLRDAYPKLCAGRYHIIVLGQDLPTLAQARKERIFGVSLIALGAGLVVWNVCSWCSARQRRKNQAWFAGDEADPQLSMGAATDRREQSFVQFDRPSELMTSARTWAVWISTPAFMVAGGFLILQSTGLIPEAVGMWGMGAGVSIGMLGIMYFLWAYRFFVEQVYETRAPDALPKKARKYFEQQTPTLESLGFVYLGDVKVIDTVHASVRLFLSVSGECVVTLESGLGQTAYNFLSIATDGTLLHTVSVDLQRPANTPLPSRCQWSPTKDVTVAFRGHQALVAAHFSESAAPCLTIGPEYVIGVMDYAHRISGWSEIERGGGKKRVPPLPRVQQLTKDGHGRQEFAWQARPNQVTFSREALDALRAAQAEHEAAVTWSEESDEVQLIEIG